MTVTSRVNKRKGKS